uniref:Cardiomyopathy associated 5 n=1 Tax=Lepisosteus oculatus TaxID=7918 RepID=W5MFT4_LEPOC
MEPCLPDECDKIEPEISFPTDDTSGEAGVLDSEEAEELRNSLKDLVQDHSVKPKLQCITVDPSFSMVTVQSEDSGIVWETASSRCSTPWASEASTTSDAYSLEGSATGSSSGKVVFIMDEDKIVRRRKRASLGNRLKAPGAETVSPNLRRDENPNVRSEQKLKSDEPTEQKEDPNSEKELFSIVSEGYEILNIIVPPKILMVDEEESIYMPDNLFYLEESPLIKSKVLLEVTEEEETPIKSERKETEQLSPAISESSQTSLAKSKNGNGDLDYFEKFTLVDDHVSNINPKEAINETKTNETSEEPENKEQASKSVSESEDPEFVFLDVEIASEHLDEVFYGMGAHVPEEEMPTKADKVLKLESPPKKSGTALFSTEEETLTRCYYYPATSKNIDPFLFEEPPAMSFLYTDLYEQAAGDKKKDDSEPSDEESVTSERILPRRLSDSDDNSGAYFEKYILIDDVPQGSDEPQPDEDQEDEAGKTWQSAFVLTGDITQRMEDNTQKTETRIESSRIRSELSPFEESEQFIAMSEEISEDLEFQPVFSDEETVPEEEVERYNKKSLKKAVEEDEIEPVEKQKEETGSTPAVECGEPLDSGMLNETLIAQDSEKIEEEIVIEKEVSMSERDRTESAGSPAEEERNDSSVFEIDDRVDQAVQDIHVSECEGSSEPELTHLDKAAMETEVSLTSDNSESKEVILEKVDETLQQLSHSIEDSDTWTKSTEKSHEEEVKKSEEIHSAQEWDSAYLSTTGSEIVMKTEEQETISSLKSAREGIQEKHEIVSEEQEDVEDKAFQNLGRGAPLRSMAPCEDLSQLGKECEPLEPELYQEPYGEHDGETAETLDYEMVTQQEVQEDFAAPETELIRDRTQGNTMTRGLTLWIEICLLKKWLKKAMRSLKLWGELQSIDKLFGDHQDHNVSPLNKAYDDIKVSFENEFRLSTLIQDDNVLCGIIQYRMNIFVVIIIVALEQLSVSESLNNRNQTASKTNDEKVRVYISTQRTFFVQYNFRNSFSFNHFKYQADCFLLHLLLLLIIETGTNCYMENVANTMSMSGFFKSVNNKYKSVIKINVLQPLEFSKCLYETVFAITVSIKKREKSAFYVLLFFDATRNLTFISRIPAFGWKVAEGILAKTFINAMNVFQTFQRRTLDSLGKTDDKVSGSVFSLIFLLLNAHLGSQVVQSVKAIIWSASVMKHLCRKLLYNSKHQIFKACDANHHCLPPFQFKLTEWIAELQGRTEKIEDLVSELELAFNTVEENCTKSEQSLEEQNDEMMKTILEQYNEMSQKMEDEKKFKLEQLYDQLVTFQESIDSAKDILEKTIKEVEEPDEVTFVTKSENVTKNLNKALEKASSLELTPSTFPVFEDYAKTTTGNGHKLFKGIAVPQTPRVQPQEPNSATSTSVIVYWKVNEGDVIDCFQVYCMEEPQGAMSEEYRVTVKESYCTLEDLEPDKCYLVWVMAVNYTGCSLPSEKTSFRTAPSGPVIKTEECTVCWDSAIIRWSSTNLAAVESFTLEYCRQYTCEGEGLRSISGIRNCEHKVLLHPNENYLFYIKAVNSAGASEQSEAALISTKGTRFCLLKETANSALVLSEDKTTIYYHEQTFRQRATLNDCLDIWGELLPPHGYHYWETTVASSEAYRIGVAYSSTPHDSPLGQNSTSWGIHCYRTPSSYRVEFLHKSVQAEIHVVDKPTRIGTLLDYINGRLVFFNAQSGQVLYSCQHRFTEACHPALALEKPGSLALHTGMAAPDFVKHS